MGVLSAFSRTAKGIFTEEFIDLFTSLAGQVGVAWRNARQTERLIAAPGSRSGRCRSPGPSSSACSPSAVPALPGVALAGICVPARQVGGDYYDFLPRGHGRPRPGDRRRRRA